MELVAVGLSASGIVLSVFVLIAVLRKPRSGQTDSHTVPEIREEIRTVSTEVRSEFGTQRHELRQTQLEMLQQLNVLIQSTATTHAEELHRERQSRLETSTELRTFIVDSLAALHATLYESAQTSLKEQVALRTAVEERFDALRRANDDKLEQVRTTVEKLQSVLNDALSANSDRIQVLAEANAAKHVELQAAIRDELDKLRIGNEAKHVELQTALRDELDKLRVGNEAKLEKMRETVDEKLQGTLEKRLGESFALVSERLEQVQAGLGEMKSLATDVGGLKRVLTNVKSRGTWGEVQLSRQLEDLLTVEQFERNVAIRPDANERVEFAVKLPGRGDTDRPVYLPIDSKFPQEDYERLVIAHEQSDMGTIEIAAKALERAVLAQAKSIAEKYIEPPHSTDFAIMYLPTEGLFAEVVRRPGLASKLQNEHRILVTGPTTLASLLNSLQMGFRTLAIEKRSSEVWQVLGAAKAEFQKYGQVWAKLEKQLQTAQNTVGEAGRRTRAVERKPRDVEVAGLGGGDLEDAFESLSLDDNTEIEELSLNDDLSVLESEELALDSSAQPRLVGS
ncbi:DNA recombination protein RmuC [Mycetocola sp.]|uniref:DNA recombination protein RmuC n=1 Tax=Mycetocola sp. TaxID=1871042 RepID=UPI0039895140